MMPARGQHGHTPTLAVNLEALAAPPSPAQAPELLRDGWVRFGNGARRDGPENPTTAPTASIRLMKTSRVWPATRPAGWRATGPARTRRGAGISWATRRTEIVNPHLYRVDEALALYAAITAPMLSVHASDDSLSRWWKGRYTLQDYHQRLAHGATAAARWCGTPGHMLHHDQPQAVAALIEDFWRQMPA